MIPAIAFSAYIGLGNVLDLPMALTAISYFERLIWGVGKWPEINQKYNELNTSFDRIHKFLSV